MVKKYIAVDIRTLYIKIYKQPIFFIQGSINDDSFAEETAKSMLEQGLKSNLFILCDDLVKYLDKYMNYELCDSVITFVICGLRELYWTYRDRLSKDEFIQLDISMSQPPPDFKNIFRYSWAEEYYNKFNMDLFQPFGIIGPYDVIHVPFLKFVRNVVIGLPIHVELSDLNIVLELHYNEWDDEINKLIDLLKTKVSCK